jgi:hypothetical protein
MKHFLDSNQFKTVSAIALVYDGKPAGKIVAKWTDNNLGGTCTVGMMIYYGPLPVQAKTTIDFSTTKRASGCGYNKFDAALGSLFLHYLPNGEGAWKACDSGRWRAWLEEQGYTVMEVL